MIVYRGPLTMVDTDIVKKNKKKAISAIVPNNK